MKAPALSDEAADPAFGATRRAGFARVLGRGSVCTRRVQITDYVRLDEADGPSEIAGSAAVFHLVAARSVCR